MLVVLVDFEVQLQAEHTHTQVIEVCRYFCLYSVGGAGAYRNTTVLAGRSIIVYPAQPMRRSEIDPLYMAEIVWRLKRPNSHLPSHTQD